ncbi:MAG: PstS family phosphate ABC transporter substrate-binding protein [Syntrophomonadaceae bacterium]
MRKFKLTLPVIFILSFLFGCRSENPKESDTPTTGKITISVDETFKPVIDSEIDTFEKIYEYAKIDVNYRPEAEAMADLLSDSARLVILTRKFTKEENSYFEKREIAPIVRKIAYDAIAVIVNNANTDTLMSMQNFRDIMSGKISRWSGVSGKSALSNIQIVFDNQNSSTVRYVKEKINNSPLAKSTYAVKDNPSVVDYVSKNRNAVGIIGVNWISDKADTLTHGFLKKIKVVALASDTAQAGEYYQPYQAYIAQKIYPLWREVYVLSGEARAGLGSGFISFLASDRGQRIILKSGLVPATMPVRLVEIRSENINITK